MDAFAGLFGCLPRVVTDAPGRVNLIGEHTDYNGGRVLPTATPQRATAALSPRPDDRVRAASANVGDGDRVTEYRLGAERRTGGWVDYVQGATRALAAAGVAIGGFDLHVDSSVPIGSGLSSSAALVLAVLRGLREVFVLRLDDVALALVGQRAETDFVGARVGVMDQMAASLADERSALLIDTRTLAHRRIPLPAEIELVVLDSGIAHRHAGGEYNTRRAECEEAARRLGVAFLCELGTAELSRLATLPPPLDRRARHAVTESARVEAAVVALEAHDFGRLGGLLRASHASLRDDFEVSVPELDLLVELAGSESEVWGARLTGGGFGGSIVMLARAGGGREAGTRIANAYAAQSGRRGTLLVPPGPSP